MPDIDLFASRLNKQVDRIVSWFPDPDATYVNAFSLDWSDFYAYIFPPFSLVMTCLQKVREDKVDCVIVCPMWTTQIWWCSLMEMLIDFPRILPSREDTLMLPHIRKVHPLHNKLTLIACRISGHLWKGETFRHNLNGSSWLHGDP